MQRSLPMALMMFVIIELGGFSKASAGVLNTGGFTVGPCYYPTTLTWSPIFSADTETPAPEAFELLPPSERVAGVRGRNRAAAPAPVNDIWAITTERRQT